MGRSLTLQMKIRGNTKGAKRSAEKIVLTNSPLKRRKQEK
jgi:hypothetical protein